MTSASFKARGDPALPGAEPLDRAARKLLPAMLAPGGTPWRAAATRLASELREEAGFDVAEAVVLGATSRCCGICAVHDAKFGAKLREAG